MRSLFQVKFWTHLRISSMMTVVTVRTRPRCFDIVFIGRFNTNWKYNFRWNPQSIWKGHAWLCHQPGKQQDRFHCSTSGVVSHWNHPIFAPWRHHGSLAHVQTFSQSKLPGFFLILTQKRGLYIVCIYVFSAVQQQRAVVGIIPRSSDDANFVGIALTGRGIRLEEAVFHKQASASGIIIHHPCKALLRKT